MSEIRFNRWSHQSGTGGIYQDSSGNIGIGTSIPTSVLDIQGGSIKIGNDLLTSSGVSTFTSGLNVTGGSVGIGTDNPSAKLEIYGDLKMWSTGRIFIGNGGNATDPMLVNVSDANTGLFFPASDTIAATTGGSERLRIASNGKVGIGSAIPTEILDVSGTGDMKMVVHTEDSGAGNNAGIRIATGDGYKWLFQVGDATTSGGLRIYQETSGSNGERLRITSGGNMGLGVIPETWSSNVKGFQIGRQACVSGQTGANIVEISANAYHNSGWKYIETDTATKYYQYQGSHRFETAGSGTADASISFTERLRITSDGGVGIGTDDPNSRQLSVYGAGINGTQIECRATGGNSSGLSMYAGRNFEIQSTTSAEANYPSSFIVYDRDANGYRMAIDGSGRVRMPAQPGFFALGTGSASATSSTSATEDLGPKFTTIPTVGGFNTGSHYNTTTGVFTAPVAGKYFTFFNIRWETGVFVQNSYIRIFISINNSNSQYYIHQINGTNEAWNNYMAMSCCGVVDLAAGDTLRPKGGMSGGTAYAYWNESSWGAWLLG